jgi:hypothetical protein
MLLNPFVLYFSTAWGQIDAIVALFSLLSLVFIFTKKTNGSAILLALAIALKPIALPIFVVTLVYLIRNSLREAVKYTIVFLSSILLFSVVPFIIFGWDPSPIYEGWNAHFTVGGGMSFVTFLELTNDTYQLPGGWWFLGLMWIPVLIIFALLALKNGIHGFEELLMKSAGLVLVFFLSRTWLSEPNLVLIFPFVLIMNSMGKLNNYVFTFFWTLPLIFTIFNTSTPQLLFPIFPEVMEKILMLSDQFRNTRLVMKTILVIPWLITGWWIVIACFRRDPAGKVY